MKLYSKCESVLQIYQALDTFSLDIRAQSQELSTLISSNLPGKDSATSRGEFFAATKTLNDEQMGMIKTSWKALFTQIADLTKPPTPERKTSLTI